MAVSSRRVGCSSLISRLSVRILVDFSVPPCPCPWKNRSLVLLQCPVWNSQKTLSHQCDINLRPFAQPLQNAINFHPIFRLWKGLTAKNFSVSAKIPSETWPLKKLWLRHAAWQQLFCWRCPSSCGYSNMSGGNVSAPRPHICPCSTWEVDGGGSDWTPGRLRIYSVWWPQMDFGVGFVNLSRIPFELHMWQWSHILDCGEMFAQSYGWSERSVMVRTLCTCAFGKSEM